MDRFHQKRSKLVVFLLDYFENLSQCFFFHSWAGDYSLNYIDWLLNQRRCLPSSAPVSFGFTQWETERSSRCNCIPSDVVPSDSQDWIFAGTAVCFVNWFQDRSPVTVGNFAMTVVCLIWWRRYFSLMEIHEQSSWISFACSPKEDAGWIHPVILSRRPVSSYYCPFGNTQPSYECVALGLYKPI